MNSPSAIEHELEKSETWPALCPNPVFIIGAPRSGTTVLAKALAQHSQFWTSDESFILSDLLGDGHFDAVFGRWASRPSSSWLRTQRVSREEFLGFLGLGINALFTDRSGGKRWIEHTPHYGVIADTLSSLLPGAMFLHIVRDGRQVVNSMIHISKTLKPDVQERMKEKDFLPAWTHDFRAACEAWRDHVQACSDFCAQHPDRSLTVDHEQLERDPVGTAERILVFLQASHEEGPAKYLSSTRINSSFRRVNDPGPSIVSRPDPEKEWSAEQKEIFAEVASEMVLRLRLTPGAEAPQAKPTREPQPDRQALLASLLADKPKLHYWNDQWNYGGLSDQILTRLFQITCEKTDQNAGVVLETGAGLSTLGLLAARPRKLITIMPDAALKERIEEQIARFSLAGPEHAFLIGRSEEILPDLVKDQDPYVDLALIDGGHMISTVFVDFSFINQILKQGGYLTIDDIQLPAVEQLFQWLKGRAEFELVDQFIKTVIFRKRQDIRFVPGS